MFVVVYLITLGKYKFWLLPNLNKDVGIVGTFWPLFEFKSNGSPGAGSNQLSSSNDADNSTPDQTSNDDRVSKQDDSLDNQSGDTRSDRRESDDSSRCVSRAPVETGASQQTDRGTPVTEFEGNDRLPTITTTPPPPSTANSPIELANSRMLFGRPADLEIIDLNTSEQEERSVERSIGAPELSETNEKQHSDSLNDFANITPLISYLNVNEAKQRKRVPSNRSDDGFEILNDDFLNSPPIIIQRKQSTPLFLAKQSLL